MKTLIVFVFIISSLTLLSQTGYWEELSPPTNPGARIEHVMCSIGDNKVLLFGGKKYGYGEINDTWIFDYETTTWTEIFPGNSPSPRRWFDMVQISENQALLYGGMSMDGLITFGELNDVWIFDLDKMNWYEVEQIDTIRPRMRHTLAKMSVNEILVFGGHIKGTKTGDSWTNETAIYSIIEKSWKEKKYLPWNLRGREVHMMTQLDEDHVLMFGGHSPGIYNMNDNWIFSKNQWDSLEVIYNIVPISSSDITHIKDGYALLFSGDCLENDPTPESHCDFTWLFDYKLKNWIKLDLNYYPHQRYAHQMAKVDNNKVLMFGGVYKEDLPPPNDTWLFTLDTLSLDVEKRTNTSKGLFISPNPATDFLTIETDGINNKIEIYNMLGISVMKAEANRQIDVSGLPRGIYFVRIDENSYSKLILH